MRGAAETAKAVRRALLRIGPMRKVHVCAPRIPDTRVGGHFAPLIERRLVAGPVVVTTSTGDWALRWFYRAAATTAREFRLGPSTVGRLPRYGAVGTYGLGGLDPSGTTELTVRPGRLRYGIDGAGYYRADASAVVVGEGFSVQGGHSNLVHPELAGLLWETVMAT